MWKPVEIAPFDRELELAVVEGDDMHALVFPCRRVARGWVKASTNSALDIHPTHWRDWDHTRPLR
jgi:hypothetical protein